MTIKGMSIVIHLFPKDLAVGFPENMSELIKQVYWDLLEGRTERLEVGFAEGVTPSWVDVESHLRRGLDVPSYPSWNIELLGYGNLPHTHVRLIGGGLKTLSERMGR